MYAECIRIMAIRICPQLCPAAPSTLTPYTLRCRLRFDIAMISMERMPPVREKASPVMFPLNSVVSRHLAIRISSAEGRFSWYRANSVTVLARPSFTPGSGISSSRGIILSIQLSARASAVRIAMVVRFFVFMAAPY